MNAYANRSIHAALALTMTLLCTSGAILAGSSSGADLERVVAKANSTGQSPYRAFRRLEAGNPDSGRHGWLEVWTEVTPGRGLSYEVVAEGGHDYIRNKVLRDVLNSEQKLIAAGHPLRASLITTNYTFGAGGSDDAGLLRVLLTPLRKSPGIVEGSMLIDPVDARLVQIQGRLIKNPSFWLRNVDVVWKYARIGHETMPVEVSSTGRVRMFGRSTFRMEYDYVSIAGRAVESPRKLARRD